MRKQPDLIITKKDKVERQNAKTTTFRVFYGASGKTLAEEMDLPEEEGELFLESFLQVFPGLKDSFEEKKRLAVERGWIEVCPYTKKRYFDPDWLTLQTLKNEIKSYFPPEYRKYSKEEKRAFMEDLYVRVPSFRAKRSEAGKIEKALQRKALNFPIQGGSSSMTKIAIMYIEKENYDLHSGVLIPVHDEIVAQYPTEQAEEKNSFVAEQMRRAGLFFSTNVPMTATAEFGDYWIH